MSTIASAQQQLGQQNWDNLCEAFVEQVTQGQTGQYGSAIQAWQAQQNKGSTDLSKMQPGDVIYFSPNAGNNGYGHTGIYEGNGMFISATPNGVAEVPLSQWLSSTGQQILGYVPQKGDGAQALAGARQVGSQLNSFLTQYRPQMQMQGQGQTMRPPMQFPQMPQQPVDMTGNQPGKPMSPNVQMPPIQNNAASSPMPIQGMMTSMSSAGQSAGANQPGTGTPPMMPSVSGQSSPQNTGTGIAGYGAYAFNPNIPTQGSQPQQVGNAQTIIAAAPTIPDITPAGGTTPTTPLNPLVSPSS